MSRRAPMVPAVVLALAVGCARKDLAPPVQVDDGGQLDAGPTDVAIRDTGAVDAPGDGEAGDASDGASDVPAKALCPKTFVGDAATPVGLLHGPGELLAGLTWDELTMVWTTVEGSKVQVHYADRGTRDAAFTSDKTLTDTLGPFGEDTVGLASDGLSMIVVSADHTTLTRFVRSARGSSFEPAAASSAFERITRVGSEGGAAKRLGDLVLSEDGQWLFYTDLNRTAGTTMMASVRLADGTWDHPNPIDGAAFEISGASRRRPSGISADSQALFFYDEVFGATYVAFRTPGTLLFSEVAPFSPTGRRAMPNRACDRVYLSMAPPAPVPDAGLVDAATDSRPPATLAIHHAP